MPLPIVSVAQMRDWESASWAAGRSATDVIQCVGRQLAARARQFTGGAGEILVLSGRGHNGDDARASLAALPVEEGLPVDASDPVAGLATLRTALGRRPRLIVDGLFGIGLNRPLTGPWLELVRTVNESGLPILAVDVPSGLHADTGEPQGGAVRATITLTLAAPKAGFFRPDAWEYTGRLEVASEIGLVPWPEAPGLSRESIAAYWTDASDFEGYPQERPVAAHKGDFGHLFIVAGSVGFHGAAVLAARAALAARPGLVTVATSPDAYTPVAGQLAAAMVHPWRTPPGLPARATAIVVGPGLAGEEVGAPIQEQVRHWWASAPLPMLADASALGWLRDVVPRPGAVRVWTPHVGEASRLLNRTTAAITAARWASARALSSGGAWTVLKGWQSVIAEPGQSSTLWVNGTGNPGLAQGGSGDVLSGYLGGLLAQPMLAADPGRALRYAVWRHGRAADRLEASRAAWDAEHLADALRLNDASRSA